MLFAASRAPLGGFLGGSWGVLGASWGPLGASWGPLGAEGPKNPFGSRVWAPCWSCLGDLLGRHGGLLGRLGAVLGRLGAVLGASRAVLGRSWGPLGRSWSVRSPKRRESKKPSKTSEKSMMFASWGPLGSCSRLSSMSSSKTRQDLLVDGGMPMFCYKA